MSAMYHMTAAKELLAADQVEPYAANRERALVHATLAQAHALTGILLHLIEKQPTAVDIPPPSSAKMRHCVGCGTSQPLTSIGGRLVEHWDPATLSDIPGPSICDQRDGRTEATL